MSSRIRNLAVAVGLVAAIGFASIPVRAADAPPASQPAGDPARIAVKRLQAALANGDADTVRDLLLADTPQQRQLDAALIRLTGSLGRLRQACDAAFGATEVNRADGLGDPAAQSADAAAFIDHAAEADDGPDAKVFRLGQSKPVRVRRTADGTWKVPLAPPVDDPAVLAGVFDQINRQSAEYDAVAADVAAGKYRTMRETMGVLQTRLMRAASPATQPAPAP